MEIKTLIYTDSDIQQPEMIYDIHIIIICKLVFKTQPIAEHIILIENHSMIDIFHVLRNCCLAKKFVITSC